MQASRMHSGIAWHGEELPFRRPFVLLAVEETLGLRAAIPSTPFLSHVDIMRARVCTRWKVAAKKSLVPPSEFSWLAVKGLTTS